MIYTNSQGNSINLNSDPYWLDCEAIRNYEWEYATKDKKRGHIIAGFTKDVKELDLELDIWGLTEEQKNKNIDAFNNLIEIDIYNGVAGTLSDGDWFTYGYFIASENTDWNKGAPMVRKKVTFVREKLSWYHITRAANFGADSDEQLFVFNEEDIKTYEGEDTNSLKSLTATINPKQDLHGYDNPWVGGAGKNKLVYPYQQGTNTINGVTFTVNNDGSVKINGTCTATGTYLWLYGSSVKSLMPTLEQGKTYTLSIDGAVAGINGQCIFYGSQSVVNTAYGSGGKYVTFTVPDMSGYNGNGIVIAVINGYTFNNVTVKPMIRLASDTDATWQPYENICPISGWDRVNVTRSGKNLFSYGELIAKDIYRATVTPIENEENAFYLCGAIGTSDVPQLTVRAWGGVYTYYDVKFKEDTVVTLTCTVKNHTADCNGFITLAYNSTGSGRDVTRVASQHFNEIGDTIITISGTIPANQYVALFMSPMSKSTDGTLAQYAEVRNVQLELGTTATAYEPYQADTYTTDLPETVYGGSLDVVNGVLTVDRAMVDLGTLNWTYSNSRFLTPTSAIGALRSANFITTKYKNGGTSSSEDKTAYFGTSNFAVLDSDYTDATSFKTAMNGVQLCYPLAEPRTIQLTPKQVTTLLGTNNVWADSGEVMVEYWDDAGRIKTASGNVVTFSKYNALSGTGYDYSYNYMTDVQSQKTITNPGSVPCDFIINIQGYVDHPILKIGDNIVSVDVEVPYGAHLTIDSTKKTVIMTLIDGTEINCFGARDPDYYLFERIPYGRNVVTWSGSFIWELKLIEERSEPRWHTV